MPIKSINGETLQVDASGIEDGAITTTKIADGTVTDEKLAPVGAGGVLDTDEYLRHNLYSAMEPTDNINDSPLGRWYYGANNGVRTLDTNGTHVGMRDLVAVEAQTDYRLKAENIGGTLYWTFYDSSRAYISAAHASSGTKNTVVTTPEGCAYISVFMYASGGLNLYDNAAIMITAETSRTSYVPQLSAVDLVARDEVNEIGRTLASGIEPTRNLNTAEVGRYSLRATGIIEYTGYETVFGTSRVIAVEPSTTYTATVYNISFGYPAQLLVGEYDANGDFTQRSTLSNFGKSTSFTTLETTHFIALQVYKGGAGITIGADSRIQVEAGTMSTDYVPPYTFIDYTAREDVGAGIPSYFLQNVQDAVTKVNDDLLSVGRHGDAFVFITDVHWRNNIGNSPALVKYVLDNTNVKMVVNGGDNLQSHLTTKAGAASEILAGARAFVFDGVRCLGVMGNHDNNRNNNSEHPEAYLSQDEQFSVINRTYCSDGLHYGDGNWYYYDNDAAKVRYLLLDWGGDSSAQTSWIAETMVSLPDGYKAVVIVHGIYRTTSGDETHEMIMERQYILDACEPYKSDILFFIQGHTHWDGVIPAYESGTPIIITSCDTYSEPAGAVRNTIDEQCFDIVVFDYSAGTIKCTRVGRGSDRTVSL